MSQEIIITGICTEKGLEVLNTESTIAYSKANVGKKFFASPRLEELYTEKEKLYAFYYGPVLSTAMKAYGHAGYIGVDKVAADHMFGAEFLKDYITGPNGEKIPTILSKSKISKDRLYQFIQDCINHLEINMGHIVPDKQQIAFFVGGRKLSGITGHKKS